MTDIYGGNTDSTFVGGLSTSEIDDLNIGDDLVKIDLSTPNTINLIAPNVLANGLPISVGGSGVNNPLTSDLSIGEYDITGLQFGQTLKGLNTQVILQNTNITTLEEKTVNITIASYPVSTTMVGILRTDTLTSGSLTSPLETSSITMNEGGIDIQSDALNFNSKTVLTTPFGAEIEATSFKKTLGTNIQYLMADGSTLTASANSGNSNFYLYNSSTNGDTTPANGLITYNNAVQSSATNIYISHRTRDNIDIEVFFKQLSTAVDVYIQDQSLSDNFIQYNITGTPAITGNSHVEIPVIVRTSAGTGSSNFPNGHNVLLSFFTNTIEIDTRISALETKTQNQTATSGSQTTFSGAGGIQCDKFVKTGGLSSQFLKADGSSESTTGTTLAQVRLDTQNIGTSVENVNTGFIGDLTASRFVKTAGLTTEFLKANGDTDSSAYIEGSLITNSSVPYINATGGISGATKNLFVMLGQNTIQSAISAITVGGSIFVSTGGSTENITCSNQNYVLSGTSCPSFTQTTQITGNLTIGATGLTSTRVRVQHMKFVGNLSFFNSLTQQELRTYFYNCDWSGTITFPTQTITATGLAIYFTDCTFSGASAITIPNQSLYTIFFTRCSFVGQTITNNLTAGNFSKLIFTDCSGLPTLSLGFCVLNGLNGTFTTTQGNFGGLVVGNNLINGSKKFVGTTTQSRTGIQTAVDVIPTVYGSKAFIANELVAGDIFKMTLVGQQSTPAGTTASFTANFFGYSYIFTFPTNTSGNFTIEINCFIRSLNVSTGGMVISHFSSVSSGSTTQSTTASVNGNTIGAHNFTLTYTADNASNTLVLYTCYMVRF